MSIKFPPLTSRFPDRLPKGLYLLVKPTGACLWRFKYRFPPREPNNKERLLALGAYPEVSEWRVPWPRMKMRETHIVPLSRQAISILREIQQLTGEGRGVFPQLRNARRPMSEACLTAALRAIGYSGAEMTWHGFRALACTQLNSLSSFGTLQLLSSTEARSGFF